MNKPTPSYTKMSDPEMLRALGDDARKWADAFCQFNPEADHANMLTWFANAIETAHEHRQRRLRQLRKQQMVRP